MNPLVVSAAIAAATQLIEFILKARQEAQRTGEWTLEQEQQFDTRMQTKFTESHWKPGAQ